MVAPAWAKAAAVAGLFQAAPCWGLEVKVAALVQASPPGWKSIPAKAQIMPDRLSFRRRAFLKSRKGMLVWSHSVKRTLAEVLGPIPVARRDMLPDLLDALRDWSAANLFVEVGPPGCPESWRDAGKVLAEKRGNRFELIRALVTILRAAGVPARPTFNGEPVIYLYATAPGEPGFWTVWDPFSQDDDFMLWPVLWLPLRAGEVPIVSIDPAWESCQPMLAGRRFASREDAAAAFARFKKDGSLPARSADGPAVLAKAPQWWELWSVGIKMEPAPREEFAVVFPLPFVQHLGYGIREHAFWVSEPVRLKKVHRIHAQTDQELGGLLISVKAQFSPAPREAKPGDA